MDCCAHRCHNDRIIASFHCSKRAKSLDSLCNRVAAWTKALVRQRLPCRKFENMGVQVAKVLGEIFCITARACNNKDWALCESIREYGSEAHTYGILEFVRGRKPAHARERELTRELQPTLNTL